MADIKFPHDFEHDSDMPIHVGRVYIGEHVMRIIFCPDGNIRATINRKAVENGVLILTDHPPADALLGFKTDDN